ncbi:MAG: alpha-amylase [Anaerolineaceae bacterium]|nr:alpha-amylase [Anaerolineaceae bacterium]
MKTPSWIPQSNFYHIYPLGMFGAPKKNDFSSPVEYRLDILYSWLDHLEWLGVNTIYLGPIFESEKHGYDTMDYFKIDRRLGDETSFKKLADEIHRRDMRIILDGVFNHVGRSHFAFRDVQMKGQNSDYASWFAGLEFNRQSPLGDPFTYATWDGHFSLPKLNLKKPTVREYLLSAVRYWMDTWQIDGLRLDAADCLDFEFIEDLNKLTKGINPDFWLMGEVVHGNYSNWAKTGHLDSVTNYECYKGLYSSLNDENYFEIAYALNRQFGPSGIYRDLFLYNFVDNHDVNRIGSQLTNSDHLFPLYGLLFTMPGVPSVYYGSEWGIPGKRTQYTDEALRPPVDLNTVMNNGPFPALPGFIKKLISLRKIYPALSEGGYEEVLVQHKIFVFRRTLAGKTIYVMLNASDQEYVLGNIGLSTNSAWKDVLNDEQINSNQMESLMIPSYSIRILVSNEISPE